MSIVSIDLFEDLLALASEEYKGTIKKARKEYAEDSVFTHEQILVI